MAIARGLVLAFAVFVASFVLHIVGGATDQSWLFAIAVVLIYIAAAGFPAIAALLSGAARGSRAWRATVIAGVVPGLVLTGSALWAANDRAVAWWHIPATPVLLAITTFAVEYAARRAGLRRQALTAEQT